MWHQKDHAVSSMSSKKRHRNNTDVVSNVRDMKSPTTSSISSYETDISNRRRHFHSNSYVVRQPLIYSQTQHHGFQNFKFNRPIINHDNKMINDNSNFKEINRRSNRGHSNSCSQIPISKKNLVLLQSVHMMLMFQSELKNFILVDIHVDNAHPTTMPQLMVKRPSIQLHRLQLMIIRRGMEIQSPWK